MADAWPEYRRLVLDNLERQEQRLNDVDDKMGSLSEKFAVVEALIISQKEQNEKKERGAWKLRAALIASLTALGTTIINVIFG